MANPSVTIIGLGKVGTAWLNTLPDIGYPVVSAYSRTQVDPDLLKKHPDIHFGRNIPQRKEELGDLVFITVSDDAISLISQQLADQFDHLEGTSILHCSGVISSEALAAVAEKGAQTAAFHPNKSITESNSSFKGIWFDMEGEDQILSQLESLAEKLEAHTFKISPQAKPYLHASAVVASNYLVVLTDMIARISEKGGIPEELALKAMAPLMKNTLSNIESAGVTDALTGPISRGDVQTVKNHLACLQTTPELLRLYKELGKSAVEIAKRISPKSDPLEQIKSILK